MSMFRFFAGVAAVPLALLAAMAGDVRAERQDAILASYASKTSDRLTTHAPCTSRGGAPVTYFRPARTPFDDRAPLKRAACEIEHLD